MFGPDYQDILDQIARIDPEKYGKTRNFIDGAVTKLSPYISCGVISTKQVYESVLNRGYHPKKIEKFIQELAWRDYWQQVWVHKGDDMNTDLRREQPNVSNFEMPAAVVDANTGIEAIDKAIQDYYTTGYLHNHVRMYIAAIACNIGGSHWRVPAQWMYYHLLDGDWASNALSWQWVSGANAGKKYYANQENIDKYCYTRQRETFMDVPYEAFEEMDIPTELRTTTIPMLKTNLPQPSEVAVDASKPTLLYNFYNLDPEWKKDITANRILLLEPDVYSKYPIADHSVNFMLGLSRNIKDIQVFVGSFEELKGQLGNAEIFFKEHPLNSYVGTEEQRDWMFTTTGYFRSFFAFWKKCQKELPR